MPLIDQVGKQAARETKRLLWVSFLLIMLAGTGTSSTEERICWSDDGSWDGLYIGGEIVRGDFAQPPFGISYDVNKCLSAKLPRLACISRLAVESADTTCRNPEVLACVLDQDKDGAVGLDDVGQMIVLSLSYLGQECK